MLTVFETKKAGAIDYIQQLLSGVPKLLPGVEMPARTTAPSVSAATQSIVNAMLLVSPADPFLAGFEARYRVTLQAGIAK